MTTTPEANDLDQTIQSPGVDSAYASPRRDSDELSTTTVTSEVLRYSEEYGRRYAVYESLFPNDEQEQEHLELFDHEIGEVLDPDLYCAPVLLSGARVLDIGTGTGNWAIKIGDADPTCVVTGVDVSMIQPIWVPTNVTFEIADVEAQWEWDQGHRFIFGRQLAGSIVDWSQLIRRCHENLEDEGWVEFQELDLKHFSQDHSMKEGNKVLELYKLQSEALSNLGRKLDVGDYIEELLHQHGFQNIVHRRYLVPLGIWPKDKKWKSIGYFRHSEFSAGLDGQIRKSFCKGLGWDPEQVQVFLMEVREDIRRRDVHMMSTLHVIYGQKTAQPRA